MSDDFHVRLNIEKDSPSPIITGLPGQCQQQNDASISSLDHPEQEDDPAPSVLSFLKYIFLREYTFLASLFLNSTLLHTPGYHAGLAKLLSTCTFEVTCYSNPPIEILSPFSTGWYQQYSPRVFRFSIGQNSWANSPFLNSSTRDCEIVTVISVLYYFSHIPRIKNSIPLVSSIVLHVERCVGHSSFVCRHYDDQLHPLKAYFICKRKLYLQWETENEATKASWVHASRAGTSNWLGLFSSSMFIIFWYWSVTFLFSILLK